MTRVFLVLVLALSTVMAHAQDATAPQIDEAKEAEIAVKAKKRLYPGGKDEGDLKVRASVTNPPRKLAPQAEVKEEPAEE